MRVRIKQQPPMLLTMIVVCLAPLAACTQRPLPTATLSSTLEPSPTPQKLPGFLSYIEPGPGAQVLEGRVQAGDVDLPYRQKRLHRPPTERGPSRRGAGTRGRSQGGRGTRRQAAVREGQQGPQDLA